MTTRVLLVTALLLTALAADVRAAGPLDHPGFAKSMTCAACHGANGNSRSDAMPILAGMDAAYFKKQIEAYAAGARPSPEMEPFAKQAVQLGVDDIAQFFAAQRMQPAASAATPAAIERGRTASAACAACHGQNGKGDVAKVIPSLAGQPAGYLREQMLLFKADKRNPNDPALKTVKALMATIPDEAYADIAAYYSSLR
jgi:cytochrome c553